MATTDQLLKAQQKSGIQLNCFRAEHYAAVLQDAGHCTKGLSKLKMFVMVKKLGLDGEVCRRFSWQSRQN